MKKYIEKPVLFLIGLILIAFLAKRKKHKKSKNYDPDCQLENINTEVPYYEVIDESVLNNISSDNEYTNYEKPEKNDESVYTQITSF